MLKNRFDNVIGEFLFKFIFEQNSENRTWAEENFTFYVSQKVMFSYYVQNSQYSY